MTKNQGMKIIEGVTKSALQKKMTKRVYPLQNIRTHYELEGKLNNWVRCKFKLNLDILNYAKAIKDNWDGICLIKPVIWKNE